MLNGILSHNQKKSGTLNLKFYNNQYSQLHLKFMMMNLGLNMEITDNYKI